MPPTPRDIARRLMAAEQQLASTRPPAWAVPAGQHLTDEELAARVFELEGRLDAEQDAQTERDRVWAELSPDEQRRWRRELDRATAMGDVRDARLRSLSDAELEAAILRGDARWAELLAERGVA